MGGRDQVTNRTLYQDAVLSEEEIRRIDATWKSDVEKKIDRMVAFMDKTERFIDVLIDREKSRETVRRAIIDKSLTALIWGVIVGLSVLVVSGVRTEVQQFIENIKQIRK